MFGLRLLLGSLPEATRAVGKHLQSGQGLRSSWKLRDTLSAAFLRELLRRGSIEDIYKTKAFIEGSPPAPWPIGKVRATTVSIPRRAIKIRPGLEVPVDSEEIDAQWVQYTGKPWNPDGSSGGFSTWFGEGQGPGLSDTRRSKKDSLKRQRTAAVDGPVDDSHPTEPMCLFFHGGAHVTCSVDTHRFLSWRLARACGDTSRKCLAVNCWSRTPASYLIEPRSSFLTVYRFLQTLWHPNDRSHRDYATQYHPTYT